MTGVTLEPVPTIVFYCPTYTKYWVLTFVFSSVNLVRWFRGVGLLHWSGSHWKGVLHISVYVSADVVVVVFTFQHCACRFRFWRREGLLFCF